MKTERPTGRVPEHSGGEMMGPRARCHGLHGKPWSHWEFILEADLTNMLME